MKLSDLATTTAKLEQGAWIDDIPVAGMEDVSLHVRGLENADFRRLQSKLLNQIPFARRRAGLGVDEQDRMNVKLLRETVLLGWSGITDEDGTTALAYSKEMAEKLLGNALFREGVLYAASLVGETRSAEQKALEGNSQTA